MTFLLLKKGRRPLYQNSSRWRINIDGPKDIFNITYITLKMCMYVCVYVLEIPFGLPF